MGSTEITLLMIDLRKELNQIYEKINLLENTNKEFKKELNIVTEFISKNLEINLKNNTNEDTNEEILSDTSEDIYIPDDMPFWLYEVTTKGTLQEKQIMMKQLIRNQSFEFYVTSKLDPDNHIANMEKKEMLKWYNKNAIIGEYAFTQELIIGHVKGIWCEFSVNNWPAQKLFDLIDRGKFGKKGEELKKIYIMMLDEYKKKYTAIVKSFDASYIPENPLEHSEQNLDEFWQRLPDILKRV